MKNKTKIIRFLKQTHLRIISRGRYYALQNRVCNVEAVGEDKYEAVVEGSGMNAYSVTIDLANPLNSFCDCPYANGNERICKHMTALLFTLFPDVSQDILYEGDNYTEQDCQIDETLLLSIDNETEKLFDNSSVTIHEVSDEEFKSIQLKSVLKRLTKEELESRLFDAYTQIEIMNRGKDEKF